MVNRRCSVYRHTHYILKALKEICPMRISIHIGRSITAIHSVVAGGNQGYRHHKHFPCFPRDPQSAELICVSVPLEGLPVRCPPSFLPMVTANCLADSIGLIFCLRENQPRFPLQRVVQRQGDMEPPFSIVTFTAHRSADPWAVSCFSVDPQWF